MLQNPVSKRNLILRKETTMKFKVMTTIFALALVAGVVALTLSLSSGAAPVSASTARNGDLHVTKECSQYYGNAGEFCTITSSNLEEIVTGSRVTYDQAAGIPAGLLDSNVVLDAGNGNWAVGRCTIYAGNILGTVGVCTFSNGTGRFAGFHARVNVSTSDPYFINYNWDGTYGFSPVPEREN
jgi:hypothetical protein